MKTLKLFFILIILGSGSFSFSQSKKKADLLYENRAYLDAAAIYNKLPKTVEILEKLGDCYYFNSQSKKASKYYAEIFNLKDRDSLSDSFYFKYFDALRGSRDYKLADEISTLYLKDALDTEEFRLKLEKISPYTYEIKNLTNQTSGSNFGVGLNGDKIVFSSTQNPKNPDYNWDKKPYLDLYEATIIGDSLQKKLDSVTPLSAPINSKKQHESSAVFSKNGNTIFFSRNHKDRVELDSDKVAVVSIYKAELLDGEWINAAPVPFASDQYSTMHPALNTDENRLYFSSDMPGSIGSFDIFYVDILDDNTYGEPVNLGVSINSQHREQFPFISKDSTLYFASNGRKGFGGLDIFSSIPKDGLFLEPLNLGETINGEKDDFAFVVVDSLNTGYLSSNRAGIDHIYAFVRQPTNRRYFIEGLVTDKVTGALLPNTTVTLFDESGNKIAEVTVGEDARYRLETQPNQSYSVEGFQPKYIPELEFFDTNDSGNIEFNIELEIESYKDAEEIVTDDKDGNTFIELENIYFDFAQWDIKQQAAQTLDVLVALLKKYPRMEIQLGAHTDSRAGDEFNMDLSIKRARSTLEYLVENGIPRARLSSKGFGETNPIVPCGDNCTEVEFSINRRCEFLILK
jgi:outer membrane protein OmpA-like peptidoglycan-associated protein/tetratricopeptide (TPR) repeat protein